MRECAGGAGVGVRGATGMLLTGSGELAVPVVVGVLVVGVLVVVGFRL